MNLIPLSSRRRAALWIAAFVLPSVPPLAADPPTATSPSAKPASAPAVVSVTTATPENIGAYPKHENHPTKKWLVNLSALGQRGNEPVSYGLQHWADYDPSHAPEAIALEGQIGMTQPGGAGWYGNGFFNFALDDQAGANCAVRAIRALDSGPRGSCEFLWELPQAWVRVRFVVVPGKLPLFCSISQVPKTEKVSRLKVRLVAYPSGYYQSGQRVGLTDHRSVKTPGRADLDPASESSLILYDDKYDLGVEGGIGGCAALAAPGYVGESKIDIGGYGCTWELTARPGGQELRFAFYNGLGRKNADLIPYLRGRFAGDLKDLAVLDFRPLRLQAAGLDSLKSEFGKLLAETKDADAEKAAFETALSHLDSLRPRVPSGPEVRLDKVDLQAEDDFLKTLDDLDGLLWKLRMKWVFSD